MHFERLTHLEFTSKLISYLWQKLSDTLGDADAICGPPKRYHI